MLAGVSRGRGQNWISPPTPYRYFRARRKAAENQYEGKSNSADSS